MTGRAWVCRSRLRAVGKPDKRSGACAGLFLPGGSGSGRLRPRHVRGAPRFGRADVDRRVEGIVVLGVQIVLYNAQRIAEADSRNARAPSDAPDDAQFGLCRADGLDQTVRRRGPGGGGEPVPVPEIIGERRCVRGRLRPRADPAAERRLLLLQRGDAPVDVRCQRFACAGELPHERGDLAVGRVELRLQPAGGAVRCGQLPLAQDGQAGEFVAQCIQHERFHRIRMQRAERTAAAGGVFVTKVKLLSA